MSWKDRLLPASIGAVDFFIQDHTFATGRRLVVHEYLSSEIVTVEDIGRKRRAFKVNGYLVGDDYDIRRTDLIKLAESEGWVQLNHPYLGYLQVYIRDLEVREEKTLGRMCSFSISLEERVFEPQVVAARGKGEAEQESRNLIDEPRIPAELLKQPAPSLLAQAQSFLQNVRNLIGNVVERALGAIRNLNAVRALVDEAVATVTEGILSVFEVYRAVAGVINGLLTIYDDVKDSFGFFLDLFNTEDSSIPGTGSFSSRLRDQENAFVGSVWVFGFAGMVIASLDEDFLTVDQAVARRQSLTESADKILSAPFIDGSLIAEVQRILSHIGTYFTNIEEGLPSIYDLKLGLQRTSSLQLSYRFYDTTNREQEILALNRIGNPLEVRGTVKLRV